MKRKPQRAVSLPTRQPSLAGGGSADRGAEHLDVEVADFLAQRVAVEA
jgi:hypothetical protein